MSTASRAFKRSLALRSTCLKCRAEPGQPCQGTRGDRTAPHRVRMDGVVLPARRTPGQSALDLGAPAFVLQKPAAVSDFYLSDAWREVRYRALALHGGACQCCGARPTAGHPLHVDHIKPRSRFPELALELSNLQILCEDCNLGKGARDQTDWRPTAGRAP